MIQWDPSPDAQALRQAMKGMGTDEKALIWVLTTKDPFQIHALRDAYNRMHSRDLEKDLKSETSGWFEKGLVALQQGPLTHEVHLVHEALAGAGTNEKELNDIVLSRSNADLNAIKAAYQHTYHRTLEEAVKSDLSGKTERQFAQILEAKRAEDAAPVNGPDIDRDVEDLYNATEARSGKDEVKVCTIMSTRNDNQIRAIAHAYQQKYGRSLEEVIKKEFHGHMEAALLFQLRHGMDKYMHQATLLEDAMAGMGTHDRLLVERIIRYHWDRNNMANVRSAYHQKYHKNLAERIKGEVSGHYQRLMLACIGEPIQ